MSPTTHVADSLCRPNRIDSVADRKMCLKNMNFIENLFRNKMKFFGFLKKRRKTKEKIAVKPLCSVNENFFLILYELKEMEDDIILKHNYEVYMDLLNKKFDLLEHDDYKSTTYYTISDNKCHSLLIDVLRNPNAFVGLKNVEREMILTYYIKIIQRYIRVKNRFH